MSAELENLTHDTENDESEMYETATKNMIK